MAAANRKNPFDLGESARLLALAMLTVAAGPASAEAENLYDMIFDDARARQEAEIDADRRGSPRVRMIIGGRAGTPAPGTLGSYRTLCVRLCDGYFFPISFAASELDFSRDQNRCEARCPGAAVRLYRHRVPGEESADMVSLAGEPYASLPTAFDYKKPGFRRPLGCGCNARIKAQRGFEVIAGEPPGNEPQPDNEAPSPAAEAASAPPEPAETVAQPLPQPAARRVRVVGPAFLPDPEGAIDLRAPAPTDVR